MKLTDFRGNYIQVLYSGNQPFKLWKQGNILEQSRIMANIPLSFYRHNTINIYFSDELPQVKILAQASTVT